MKDSWRWYGAYDKISLADIGQTGARGIVTALHEIAYGEVWPRQAIAARKAEIAAAGFDWVVVESLPIHERIKRGEGDLSLLFANYRQSMANLAAEGVTAICYNFMPLLDWTRTDLAHPTVGGATCLRFSAPKMAAFEIHMLGRRAAEADYPEAVLVEARHWFEQSSEADRALLLRSIMSGLPGAFDRYDIAGLRTALAGYEGIGLAELRQNFRRFLDEVIPAADELGIRLCVHPDDPPRDILGLPRIVSTAADMQAIATMVDSPANGFTFCTGSYGVRPDNDLCAMFRTHADRVHFLHLRATKREEGGLTFHEAAHLDGDVDMVAVIREIVAVERRRGIALPMRPDHGHQLLDDLRKTSTPGYPAIGRLRGLAELRGVERAVKALI